MQMVRPERANPVCPGLERACFEYLQGQLLDGRMRESPQAKRGKGFSATDKVKLVKLDFLANGGQKMSLDERFLLRNERIISGKEIWSKDGGKVVKRYDRRGTKH